MGSRDIICLDRFCFTGPVLTFSFPGQVSLDVKKKRFSLYNYVSFGPPLVSVLLCIILEYMGGNLIGYGAGGICFVVSIWANLFSFVVPVGTLFVLNAVCFVATIRKIYFTQKRIRCVISKSMSSRKENLYLVIITFKISTEELAGFYISLPAQQNLQYLLTYLCFLLAIRAWLTL